MTQTRTLRFKGKTIKVVKLHSSGVGTQYTVFNKSADGKEQALLLTPQTVEKSPEHFELYEFCAKSFDDSLSLAKYIGSSSFWQSQTPPDGYKPDIEE